MEENYKNKIKWALFTIFIISIIVFFIIALSNISTENIEDISVSETFNDTTFKCPKYYENKELEEQGMIKFKENYFKVNAPANVNEQDFENYKNYMMESYDCLDKEFEDSKIEENIVTETSIDKSELELDKTNTDIKKTISEIVTEWKPRVVVVACKWIDPTNRKTLEVVRGSGTLNYFSDGFNVITNRHVLTNDQGNIADSCMTLFPWDKDFTIYNQNNNIQTGFSEDFGYLKVPNDSFFSKFSTKGFNACNLESVNIGDELIILGFPVIGSENGITATDGIVSGIEPNYFVTSAKIDGGNSGGTAILVKENCYLGIPTSAMIGKTESLGRILKWNFFLK